MQGRVANQNTVLKDVFELCEVALEDSLKTLGFICFVEKGKEQAYENAKVAEITRKHGEKIKSNRDVIASAFLGENVVRALDSTNHKTATAEIARFKASIRYVESKRIPNVLVLQKQNSARLDQLYLERIINICLIRTDLIEIKKEAAGRANISNPDFDNFLDQAFTQIKILQEREASLLRSNQMFAGLPPSHCIAICNTELKKVLAADSQYRYKN